MPLPAHGRGLLGTRCCRSDLAETAAHREGCHPRRGSSARRTGEHEWTTVRESFSRVGEDDRTLWRTVNVGAWGRQPVTSHLRRFTTCSSSTLVVSTVCISPRGSWAPNEHFVLIFELVQCSYRLNRNRDPSTMLCSLHCTQNSHHCYHNAAKGHVKQTRYHKHRLLVTQIECVDKRRKKIGAQP